MGIITPHISSCICTNSVLATIPWRRRHRSDGRGDSMARGGGGARDRVAADVSSLTGTPGNDTATVIVGAHDGGKDDKICEGDRDGRDIGSPFQAPELCRLGGGQVLGDAEDLVEENPDDVADGGGR